jgi:hypothetical protein
MEIVETGNLEKLDAFNSRNDINSIKLFTNMHGVGKLSYFSSIFLNLTNIIKDLKQLNLGLSKVIVQSMI